MPDSPDVWVNAAAGEDESKAGLPENETYEWRGTFTDPGCFLGCCATKGMTLTLTCDGRGDATGSTDGAVGEYDVKGRWKRARVHFTFAGAGSGSRGRVTCVAMLKPDNRTLSGRWKSAVTSGQSGVFELTRNSSANKKLTAKEKRAAGIAELHNADFM